MNHETTTDPPDPERRRTLRSHYLKAAKIGLATFGLLTAVWLLFVLSRVESFSVKSLGEFGDAMAPIAMLGSLALLAFTAIAVIWQREDIDVQLEEIRKSTQAQQTMADRQQQLIEAQQESTKALRETAEAQQAATAALVKAADAQKAIADKQNESIEAQRAANEALGRTAEAQQASTEALVKNAQAQQSAADALVRTAEAREREIDLEILQKLEGEIMAFKERVEAVATNVAAAHEQAKAVNDSLEGTYVDPQTAMNRHKVQGRAFKLQSLDHQATGFRNNSRHTIKRLHEEVVDWIAEIPSETPQARDGRRVNLPNRYRELERLREDFEKRVERPSTELGVQLAQAPMTVLLEGNGGHREEF